MSHLKVNSETVRQNPVDLPSIALNTTTDVQVSAPRCKIGEMYLVAFDLGASGLDDGVGYCATAHCVADDTLDVRFINPTAGNIDPPAGVLMTYIQL